MIEVHWMYKTGIGLRCLMSNVDPMGLASCNRSAPNVGTRTVECAKMAYSASNKMSHDGLMETHRKKYPPSVLSPHLFLLNPETLADTS